MILKIFKIESYPELFSSLLLFLFLDQFSNLCKSNTIICNIAHKSEKQNTLTSLETILMRNKVLITFSINKGEKSSDGAVKKCTEENVFFGKMRLEKFQRLHSDYIMLSEYSNAL